MRLLGILLMAGLLLAATGVQADQVTLVDKGQPTAAIVIAQEPTRAAQLAAAELQWHIEQITGITMPVVKDNRVVRGTQILVGESAATVALGLHSADFKPQEYLVRVRPDVIVLMGRDKDDRQPFDYANHTTWPGWYDEQATTYAAYDFLEKLCDVRWYLPTELGICLPRRPNLAVSEIEIRRVPAMTTRDTWRGGNFPADLCGDSVAGGHPIPPLEPREMKLWWHRLRVVGGEARSANHSLYHYYELYWEPSTNPRLAQLFRGKKPEWFAQGYEGKPPQMCYTNPELIQQVIQEARDYFDEGGYPPEIRQLCNAPQGAKWGENYFAVVPMDNSSYCKCPQCQALLDAQADKQQFSSGHWSDYIFTFVNEIARGIAETHPDKQISASAYASYAWPPRHVKVEPNVAVSMCLHTRNVYGLSLQDNDHALLDAWFQESPTRPKGVYMYFCFPALNALQQGFRCFPGFFAHNLVKEMQRYHQAGVTAITYEPSYLANSQRSPLLDQLEMLIAAKMADDPTVDGNAYIDEFFTRYYGHAARPMKQMYEMIENIYSDPGNYPPNPGHQTEEMAWKYLGTPERMEALGRLMTQAQAEARESLEVRRVALFEKGLWQYMLKGRTGYLVRQWWKQPDPQLQRSLAIPRIEPAEGDPSQADFTEAATIKAWLTETGEPSERKLEARLVHDGKYLYARLQDASPRTSPDDTWDLVCTFRPDLPACRYRFWPDGHVTASYGSTANWKSGAVTKIESAPEGVSVLRAALPLRTLTGRGVEAGWQFRATLSRIAADGHHAVWLPTVAGSELPEWLGTFSLLSPLPGDAATTPSQNLPPEQTLAPGINMRVLDPHDLTMATDDLLQGKPFTTSPQETSWYGGGRWLREPCPLLSDAATPRAPLSDVMVQGAQEIALDWELGETLPAEQVLQTIRLTWSRADMARSGFRVKFAVRDARTQAWSDLTEFLERPNSATQYNTYGVLEVDLSDRKITGFDAFRMIDGRGKYNTRFVEVDAIVGPRD